MNRVDCVTIFGGTGFIGTHLAQHILCHGLAETIYLVDLLPPRVESYTPELRDGLRSGAVKFIEYDVRSPIPLSLVPERAKVVFNLAAVHREPGHAPPEYFETNVLGAENVCSYARSIECPRMVFTSSISPYGPSEERKDETSLPVPETPYGSSKLVAETIHKGWQAASAGRKLLILRPGVVFGPGENGNVTRLVRSVIKGYFVYVGNRQTIKSGGYVKELCAVIEYGLDFQDRTGEPLTILNFSMNPPPTLEMYVNTIREVSGRKTITPAIPRPLLLGASYCVDSVARMAQIEQPLNPARVRKLYRSTFIDPKRLRELGYSWRFTLQEALRDWKQDRPKDFLR